MIDNEGQYQGQKELRELVADNIILKGKVETIRRYGTGEGDGERPLRYHNGMHVSDVVMAAKELAEAAGLNKEEVLLLTIAAAWHDVEQDMGSGANEDESARLAEEAMRKTGMYDDIQIEKVKRYIKATKVEFDKEGHMSQKAGDDLGERLMADADLMSLGTNLYEDRAYRFGLELAKKDEMTNEEARKFWSGQVKFIESHEYLTDIAREKYNMKQENIRKAKELAGL